MVNIHPRHEETTRAGLDIQSAVMSASSKYSLTFAEVVNILAVVLTSWSKSAVIAERVVPAQRGATLCEFSGPYGQPCLMCGKSWMSPDHQSPVFDPKVAR